jgi:hypothetical protein
MDDLVKRAMVKWPNVPHCYGWLGLDARGRWYMRDESAQRAGYFDSGMPYAKGSELRHEKLIDFIGRNYGVDEEGQWYFQNGPQRVYVELEVAPWVWRMEPDGTLCSHTGRVANSRMFWVDEAGRLFIQTDLGLGLVHSQDVLRVAESIEQLRIQVQECKYSDILLQYQIVKSPQRRQLKSRQSRLLI